MDLTILGLSTSPPPHSVEQREAADWATDYCCQNPRQARMLSALYRKSRVGTRGSVLLEEPNGNGPQQSFFPPRDLDEDRGPSTAERMERYHLEAARLATSAGQIALERAGTAPADITQVVTVSCTGFAAPNFDTAMIGKLGLPPTVGRTHIGFMGCHAAINGIRVAQGLAAADPDARVLLCSVELCTLHFHYGWNPEQIVVNALFADGAAALVAAPSQSGDSGSWRVTATGSAIFPDSRDSMGWRITDHGFVMHLSPRVPEAIHDHLGEWINGWLADQGLNVGDVKSWAIHPGGPRILDAVTGCLDLPDSAAQASRSVLAEHGNMSSATTLYILERLRAQDAPRPCVALAFGPGLAVEAALIR